MKKLTITLQPSLAKRIEHDRKFRQSPGLLAAIGFPQRLWESCLMQDVIRDTEGPEPIDGIPHGVSRLFSGYSTAERRDVLHGFENATRAQAYVKQFTEEAVHVEVVFHYSGGHKSHLSTYFGLRDGVPGGVSGGSGW